MGVKAVQNGINTLSIDAENLVEWMRWMKDTALQGSPVRVVSASRCLSSTSSGSRAYSSLSSASSDRAPHHVDQEHHRMSSDVG
jgi:hypothetical protein